MSIHPWMIVAWLVVTGALLVVLVYRAMLTQRETDQLFLSDEESLSASHVEQDRVLQRVQQMRPYCQGLAGASLLLSVLIMGIYLVQVWPDLQFRLH